MVSTTGSATISDSSGANLRVKDEDLIVLTATSLGENSSGHWDLYFDGSTVSGLGSEDIAGAWLDVDNGDLYLTVGTSFNIAGVRGNTKNILRLRPVAGGYEAQSYWYGPDHGFRGIPTSFEIVR